MKKSENINELAQALAKAQGQMGPAVFNRQNPHFKSRFADFTSCMDACRKPLSENGLSIMQCSETIDGKPVLITMLAHSSGQWVQAEFPLLTAKMDSQGLGSAMTYAKRYSLCAMVGIVADEDDDGEATLDRPSDRAKPVAKHLDPIKVNQAVAGPKMSAAQAEELYALADQCPAELIEKMRKFMRSTFGAESFEQCPVVQFDVFKSSMVKHIEMTQKEKTA